MHAVIVLWVWILTALSGLTLLTAWLTTPEVRRARVAGGRHRRLPPSLVSGHLCAAALGLFMWGVFALWGRTLFAWGALALIAVAVAIGITMFVRWVPTYREAADGTGAARPDHHRGGRHRRTPARKRRGNIPLALVAGHGVLAVATIVLMALTLVAL